jgi:hypothetical protein
MPFSLQLPALGPNAAISAGLLAIVLGLVSCFAGYRLFRLFLGLYGFVLGGLLGAALAAAQLPGNDFVGAVGLVLGGLLGAALLTASYLVGVFAVGALGGLMLADLFGLHAAFGPLGVFITALALGVLALVLQKILISLSTAFSGAWAVIGGVVALLGRGPTALLDPFTPPTGLIRDLPAAAVIAAWLLLGLAGAVVQLRGPDRPPPPPPPPPRD